MIVVWRITQRCNLSCPFCAYDRTSSWPRRDADSSVIRLNGSDNYLRRIQASSRDEAIPVANCRPGEQFVFINDSGLAAPCNFTTRGYGVSLAELDSVEALRELPQRFARRRAEMPLLPCRDCHSTQVFEKFAA